MCYILFVNPDILGAAGMPVADVAIATALGSAIGCFLMGFLTDFPFALAPGMGINAFFAFTVVLGMGLSWQQALAIVFVEGLLFMALSFWGAREAALRAIPMSIKMATMTGIGLFLALIGFEKCGLVVADQATLVTMGDVRQPALLLSLGGLLVIGVLMARKIKGAILIGVLLVTGIAWFFGLSPMPEAWFQLPSLPTETFLAMDFTGILSMTSIVVILSFFFVDFFDTAGTLIGVGRLSGFLDDEGHLPGATKAFFADAVGTTIGACLGTSPVTSYVESAAGVEEGGRTGLTAVVVGVLFLVALFFTPVFTAVPGIATAPAIIVVGTMMMHGAREIPWEKLDESLPAFLIIVLMPFTYSITNGITVGIIAWVLVKLLAGKWREISPVMAVLAFLLILFYAFVKP
jgi:AGZA family xanthine/uracil permease-like MFS transporter